jgi:hypothetical protein
MVDAMLVACYAVWGGMIFSVALLSIELWW